MEAKEFYSALLGSIKYRKDVAVKKYKLKYSKGKYDFLRIASRKISSKDKVILIRAGIHGDEISGPLTILSFCDGIINYIHRSGLKCIIYPLGNPSGFELGTRYNEDYQPGGPPNNDFLRYELEDEKITDDLRGGAAYKRWYWCSDPILKAPEFEKKLDKKIELPQETSLMHKLLKNDALFQVAAVIDLHQDCISKLPAFAYQYAFGDLPCYKGIIEKICEFVPILRNTEVSAGESYPEKSDAQGFIVRHDGTLPDLFFRLGAKHCITAETTKATPLEAAKIVNLIWISGIVDLVK